MPSSVLVTRRDPSGAWEMVEAAPAPPLRELVHRYVGFTERSAVPLRRREVPTGRAVLILNLGAPFTVTVPASLPGSNAVSVAERDQVRSSAAAATHRGSFVARLAATPAVTEFVGTAEGIQVDLAPRGARMLLGLPMDALPEPSVGLEEVIGAEADLLVEELASVPGWRRRFQRLDLFLADRFAAAVEPAPSAEWAWRALEGSGGRIEIGRLAERLGCSRRHLIAAFRDLVGVPPKTAAAILRFERAADLLRRPGTDLAAVAFDCGYHDQSHMARDFRRLAGTTPSRFARVARAEGLGIAEGQVNSVQDQSSVAA